MSDENRTHVSRKEARRRAERKVTSGGRFVVWIVTAMVFGVLLMVAVLLLARA